MITVLTFLLYLLICGLVIWLIIWVLGLVFPNIPGQVKQILIAILVIAAIIWLLNTTGVLSGFPRLR